MHFRFQKSSLLMLCMKIYQQSCRLFQYRRSNCHIIYSVDRSIACEPPGDKNLAITGLDFKLSKLFDHYFINIEKQFDHTILRFVTKQAFIESAAEPDSYRTDNYGLTGSGFSRKDIKPFGKIDIEFIYQCYI